jgi:allophanate hydrolase subunit 2
VIRVVSAVGVVTVQDQGRPGFMHLGVPPGGALVKHALARANHALGNPSTAAALEIFGRLVVEATARTLLATDDGELHPLAPAARATFSSAGARVRYVALAGGVDVPLRLGSRSTLLVARFGGHDGRALRAGDVLAGGAATRPAPSPLPPAPSSHRTFLLLPGTEPGALDGDWTIAPASDRIGVRLRPANEGAPLPRAALGASVPMVQGAIQVPPDGNPIVLGPDHPTTGGYPVLGFLERADLDRFFALPLGSTVRFASAG